MTLVKGLKNPLCVALDHDDPRAVVDLADRLGPHAGLLKVGLTAFTSGGPDLVREVAERGPVFLDLKLHDIPAQVAGAAAAARALGVRCLTVHASGGRAMIEAAAEGAGDDVTVLAVSVLTSLDDHDLVTMNVRVGARDQVVALAHLAVDAGADGLVCSPREVAAVRHALGDRASGGPLLVVPGIRAHATSDDQKRTMGARATLDEGADVVVVGRPITASSDPVAAARALVEELTR